MSDDNDRLHIEMDDDFPEPGPDVADQLFTDKNDMTWHCLYIEEAGWAWVPVERPPWQRIDE